jgi:hypothetical protein
MKGRCAFAADLPEEKLTASVLSHSPQARRIKKFPAFIKSSQVRNASPITRLVLCRELQQSLEMVLSDLLRV